MSIFGIGLHAARAEFRSTDVNGKPVDVTTEGDTARSERIWALQDRWVPRQLPSTEPADVMAEWMARSPDNRMSAFARHLADDPSLMPAAEVEPGPGESPRPGGLIERMERQREDRVRRAQWGLTR